MKKISIISVLKILSIITGFLLLSQAVISQHPNDIHELGIYTYDNLDEGISDLLFSEVTTGYQQKKLVKRLLEFDLNMGETYSLGGNSWEITLIMEITATNFLTGDLIRTDVIDFKILDNGSDVKPRQVAYIDYFDIYEPVNLQINSTISVLGSDPIWQLAEDDVRLIITALNDVRYGTKNASGLSSIEPQTLKVEAVGKNTLDNRVNGVTFSWELPNQAERYMPAYDLEILKVEEYADNPGFFEIDWNKAARIEVEDGQQEYTMTLAEGTGNYIWRVRCVGDYYEGGRSDRRNYGEWNNETVSFPTDPLAVGNDGGNCFLYEQFNEDINWIYGKILTEGSRQSEKMTFADGLNMVHQQQTKIFSVSEVVAQQTVYDYSARPALNSLAAPVESRWLGYTPGLFGKTDGHPVTAYDFDYNDQTVNNIYTPPDLNENNGTVNEYYSDQQQGSIYDAYVPHAQGVPYTRALYQPDATGRVYKQSAPGAAMQLTESDIAGAGHNIITRYGSVSQTELDRLFGAEAPEDSTVYQVQIQDANGVISVQYIGKDGKVLATMINNASQIENMSEVDGCSDNDPFPVTKTMPPGTTAPGDIVNISTISLIVDQHPVNDPDKDFTFTYRLEPAKFEICEEICWACDYLLVIEATNPHTPDVNPIPIHTQIFSPIDLLAGETNLCTNYDPVAYTLPDIVVTMPLPPGTYIIEKKVYAYNTDPDAPPIYNDGLNYLDHRVKDLESLAETWTNTEGNNCCGPFDPDISGFDCNNDPPTCGEFWQWSFDYYNNYIEKELMYQLNDGSYYTDYLNVEITELTSYQYYDDVASFMGFISDLCNDPNISNEDLFTCMTVYGEWLLQNINNLELIENGEGGVGGNDNPIVDFNPDFDLLENIFQCVGYDPDGDFCQSYKKVYTWVNLPSSPQEYVICLYTLDNDISGGPTSIPIGKVKYVQMPSHSEIEGGTATPLLLNKMNCYDIALLGNVWSEDYGNYLTTLLSDPEAMEQFASQFCNCLKGQDDYQDPVPGETQGMEEVVNICAQACINKTYMFEEAINQYITEQNHANGIYTDEIDPDTEYSIWDDSGIFFWQNYDDFFKPPPDNNLECVLTILTNECINKCELDHALYAQEMMQDYINCDCDAPPIEPCWFETPPPYNEIFSCPEDFINSEYFQNLIHNEQQNFTEAYTYAVEVVPAITNHYSNIPDPEITEEQIIDFFNDELEKIMNFRSDGQPLSSSPDYQESFFFNTGADLLVQQSEMEFVYKMTDGSNRTGIAVVNVVWDDGEDDGDNYTAPLDDIIKEINIATYCADNNDQLLYWAYSPVDPCPLFTPDAFGFALEQRIVNFYFDTYGQFHAVLRPQECGVDDPTVIQSQDVCTGNAMAFTTLDFTNVNGGDLTIKVGTQGTEFYLYNVPIEYEAVNPPNLTTVIQNIIIGININLTEPNFVAYEGSDPETMIIALSDPGYFVNLTDYPVTLQGSMNIPPPAYLDYYSQSLKSLMMACTTSVTEVHDQVCPIGYEYIASVGNTNSFVVYDLMDGTDDDDDYDLDAFIDKIQDIWSESLSQIIVNRTPVQNPVFPFDDTDSYYQDINNPVTYEKGDIIYVEYTSGGYDHILYVYTTILGNEINDEKNIYAVKFTIACENDLGHPIFYFTGYNKTKDLQPYPLDGLTYPGFDPMSGNYNYLSELFGDIGFNNGPSDYYFIFYPTMIWDEESIFEQHGAAYQSSYDEVIQGPDISSDFNELFDIGYISECAEFHRCMVCLHWKKPEFPFYDVQINEITCEDMLHEYENNQIDFYLATCLEDKEQELKDNYYANCIEHINDELTIEYELNSGYYTLYYYDRAGNLIRTVAPKGVEPYTDAFAEKEAIEEKRGGIITGDILPQHMDIDENMEYVDAVVTKYNYNSIKQLIKDETPDRGLTYYWYNATGQLILSQNAKQRIDDKYSYITYDKLGRIIESGEIIGFIPAFNDKPDYDPLTDEPGQIIEQLWTNMDFPHNVLLAGYNERVFTEYTIPGSSVFYMNNPDIPQKNLRNRISHVYSENDTDDPDDDIHTWYSYDPHGNVEWMIQVLPDIGMKTIRYEYDLVSGNVKKVFYNEGTAEQFIHRYKYDEDNRITFVYTSKDGIIWDRDAGYDYYTHGPLARMELGEDNLQGVDYVYTTEGYLKSINQVELDETKDPHLDGTYKGTVGFFDNGTGSVGININDGTVNVSETWASDDTPESFAKKMVKKINAEYDPASKQYKAGQNKEKGKEWIIYIYGPLPSSTADIATTGNQNSAKVMEEDGTWANTGPMILNNSYIADEFAMELGYYHNDYSRLNTFVGAGQANSSYSAHYPYNPDHFIENTPFDPSYSGLYNGNIAYWQTNTRSGQAVQDGIEPIDIKTHIYRYDRLNRLKSSTYFKYMQPSNTYQATSAFSETFLYDLNGNIKDVLRYGNENNVIDDLTYNYDDNDGIYTGNRLLQVEEYADYNIGVGDQLANNYDYDEIGNLICDGEANIQTIKWTVAGKVKEVIRYSNNDKPDLEFKYDANGNRVMKIVKTKVPDPSEPQYNIDKLEKTYYVRDAQGNIMAIYNKRYVEADDEDKLFLEELPIYGSSRIGEYRPNMEIEFPGQYIIEQPEVKEKYAPELSHWLLGSKKITGSTGNMSEIDFSGETALVDEIFSGEEIYKNITIAEDIHGQPKFTFISAKNNNVWNNFVLSPAYQYQVLLDNGFFCNDCPGNEGGTQFLLGDFRTKSITAQSSENPNIFYIFTGDNGIMYYHKVDMSQGTSGKVVDINRKLRKEGGASLTYDPDVNQYALAVYNDLDNVESNRLFVSVNTGSEIILYNFAISEDEIDEGIGMIIPEGGITYVEGINKRVNLTDMHISPLGNELSICLYSTESEKHEVVQYYIDVETGSLTYTDSKTITTESNPSGILQNTLKKRVYSYDYLPDGDAICLVKRYQPGPGPIPYVKISDMPSFIANNLSMNRFRRTVRDVSPAFKKNHIEVDWFNMDTEEPYQQKFTYQQHFGEYELRRGKDRNIYHNHIKDNYITTYSGDFGGTPTESQLTLASGYNANFGLPLQPYKKKTFILPITSDRKLGDKLYELTDHLGNVRTTFTDRRLSVYNKQYELAYCELDVNSWNDYYPFGSIMPGRSFNPSEYRFGFNGKEKDDEWHGSTGTIYDYGFRIYDPRIARFLSVDPLTSSYPHYTPYQFAGNNPIKFIDLDGLEEALPKVHDGSTEISKIDWEFVGFIVQTGVKIALIPLGEVFPMVGMAHSAYGTSQPILIPGQDFEAIDMSLAEASLSQAKKQIEQGGEFIDFVETLKEVNVTLDEYNENLIEAALLTEEQFDELIGGDISLADLETTYPSTIMSEIEMEENEDKSKLIFYRKSDAKSNFFESADMVFELEQNNNE